MKYLTVFSVVGLGGLLLVQQISTGASEVASQWAMHSESTAEEVKIQQAIEGGLDPSDALPATGAGKLSLGCYQGSVTIERVGLREIEGDYTAQYIAYERKGTRYIRMNGKHQVYLKKSPFQFVTAEIIVPDDKLEDSFDRVMPGHCHQEDLHLTRLILSGSHDLNASIH